MSDNFLYPGKAEKALDKQLFLAPPSEYRGAPFWSWNTKLNVHETVRQTSVFKEMGFGGYHAHVRSGLDTPYLSEEFNENIRASAEEARKQGMFLYLYDEDRWPSGAAGGLVTKDLRLSARYLNFTVRRVKDKPLLDSDGKLLKGSKLLARYVVRTFGGKLLSYRRLSDGKKAAGVIWYAYLTTEKPRCFLNNSPYLDTLNKEAVDKFAEITYGEYKKTVGEFFGKEIKSIFTDEPQYHRFNIPYFPLPYFNKKRPWTDDFDTTFEREYGYSLLNKLPELFWKTGEVSLTRYHYYNHLSERFAQGFCDNLGKRCGDMGIALTGHLMEEPTLRSQTQATGDAMRQYRGFQIPGIDILNSRYEFTTAKQAQSVVRQYGREGMTSELYGVSRWDNDFRNYKLEGDWQAALGVTLRVPHLSHMSMKGFAKRDYPASIFYQSPWYKKYKLLEDHFARVNTALTRGKPLTEIAVIHPIESFWTLYGENAHIKSLKYDRKFSQITRMLLLNGFDFDFICEANFPSLTKEGNYPLQVGAMQYKTVIIPNCITLRSTTLERLEAFRKSGGEVIFAGTVPEYENGLNSNRAKKLAEISRFVPFTEAEIVSALESNRLYGAYENGRHTDNLVSQLREDNGGLWLFAAKGKKPDNTFKQEITLKVKGVWQASVWNTLSGEVNAVESASDGVFTFVNTCLYAHDSILIRFEKTSAENAKETQKVFTKSVLLENCADYELSEPNALLLDMAYYALDDKKYSKRKEELLRLDNICRKKCNLPLRSHNSPQPWALEKTANEHTLRLKFVIESETEVREPYIALEDAESTGIVLNGERVKSDICGWYVDKAIQKVRLPSIRKGKNILELSLPFGANTNVEWCYLLGDFGVSLRGSKAKVTQLPEKLQFTDITQQGLPFYGGKITYVTEFDGNGKNANVIVPEFKAALVEAATTETKEIAFSPYQAELPTEKGKTKLKLTAYISRQNAFGPVHIRYADKLRISPRNYYPIGLLYIRRYVLSPAGILSVPEIKLE